MLSNDQALSAEKTRMKYAFWLAIIGLLLSTALVVFLVLGAGMKTSTDILGIVGVFTGVTGTLVGTFFGAQIGAAGKEREQANRWHAEKMLQMALPHVTDDAMKQAILDEMSK